MYPGAPGPVPNSQRYKQRTFFLLICQCTPTLLQYILRSTESNYPNIGKDWYKTHAEMPTEHLSQRRSS